MIGNSIKCDVCGNMEPIDDISMLDSLPGWIRISLNKPADFGWDRSRRSSFVYEADCCSISCARSVLGEAADAVTVNE